MKMKIGNKSKHTLPEYSTMAEACLALLDNIDNDILTEPILRKPTPDSRLPETPLEFEMQTCLKRGLSKIRGITILNSTRTIGSD
jgi:dUTP pyrophosphatase